jgi:hypothetical protein
LGLLLAAYGRPPMADQYLDIGKQTTGGK